MKNNKSLKILSLGGWSGVNQNLFVYETPKDLMIFDCGVGFPEDPLSKVDLLVPDINYLLSRKNKIRGVLISHGHMDHYGALPYVLPELGNPPVWATRLVAGFIKSSFADFNLELPKLNLIKPEKKSFAIGGFEIFPFRVNHSVPDALGFCLQTPAGRIFHVSDFKFDLTPVDGKVFEIRRAARLAFPKVLLLLSDCLGAVHPGFTSSEKEIENIFFKIVNETKGQLLITTLSSNISRFRQAVEASLRLGRRIVLVGRSVEEKIRIAQKLGYLPFKSNQFVSLKKAKKIPSHRLTFLVAGSYGQPDSALSRLANDDYRDLRIEKGATVVFSADPAPPGTRETVDALVDKLTLKGAKVYYYEIQENLHVSGHGSASDLRLLMTLVKPRHFVPIGGDPRHIRAYRFLAEEMGFKKGQVFELFGGEILSLTKQGVQVSGELKVKPRGIKSR